jgi:hypothetical protein
MSEAEILAAVAEEIKRGDARSAEYQRGMAAVLRWRERNVRIPCPYRLGTAEADAYFSGTDRGHVLWRKLHTPDAT